MSHDLQHPIKIHEVRKPLYSDILTSDWLQGSCSSCLTTLTSNVAVRKEESVLTLTDKGRSLASLAEKEILKH